MHEGHQYNISGGVCPLRDSFEWTGERESRRPVRLSSSDACVLNPALWSQHVIVIFRDVALATDHLDTTLAIAFVVLAATDL